MVNIPTNSLYAICSVIGLLVAASTIRLLLGWKKPNTDYTESAPEDSVLVDYGRHLIRCSRDQQNRRYDFFWILKFCGSQRVFIHCANATI